MILYEYNEMVFTTNGLGPLPDAVSAEVHEVLNGEYEMSFTYPLDGLHADLITYDRIVLVEPAPGEDPEPFRIYRIEAGMREMAVYGRHIRYWMSDIPVMPFTATGIQNALTGLVTNAAVTCPFTLTTDRTTASEYDLETPASMASLLGGTRGSILDVYGHGEWKFTKFLATFYAARGQDRGVTIRYGKNLTDLSQEENIESMLTGICPFYKKDDQVVVLPEGVLTSTQVGSHQRIKTVDFSSYFEEVPTVAQLRARAQTYINNNYVGVPKVSLNISFVALADTEDYADIAPLETVLMGDTVTVKFESLGVSSSAEVVETKYDPLKGRYTSITLGSTRADFAETYVAQIEETDTKISEAESRLQADIYDATAAITGNKGGYVVIKDTDADDEPDEILIMNTKDIDTATKVWRWNSSGLGYSSTGYNGTYGLAMTSAGAIVADFIKAGTLDASAITVSNLSADSITAGTLTSIAINNGSGTFSVSDLGVLTASSATITGNVTATSGTIGGFTVDANGFDVTLTDGTVFAIDNSGKVSLVDSSSNETYLGAGYLQVKSSGKHGYFDGYTLYGSDSSSYFSIRPTELTMSGYIMAASASFTGGVSAATLTGTVTATVTDVADLTDPASFYTTTSIYGDTTGIGYNRYHIFLTSGSDERLKNVEEVGGDYKAFYMALSPVRYTFKEGLYGGTRPYDFFGFTAQGVEEALKAGGYDGSYRLEYERTPDADSGEDLYVDDKVKYLDKEELHAFHVMMIQDLEKRVAALEGRANGNSDN